MHVLKKSNALATEHGAAGLTAHPLPRGPDRAVLLRSHRLTEHPVRAQETETSYTTCTCGGKITFTPWRVFHSTKTDETDEEQISLSLPGATGWTAPHSPGAASAEAGEGVWGSGGTTSGDQDSSGPPPAFLGQRALSWARPQPGSE